MRVRVRIRTPNCSGDAPPAVECCAPLLRRHPRVPYHAIVRVTARPNSTHTCAVPRAEGPSRTPPPHPGYPPAAGEVGALPAPGPVVRLSTQPLHTYVYGHVRGHVEPTHMRVQARDLDLRTRHTCVRGCAYAPSNCIGDAPPAAESRAPLWRLCVRS